MSAVGRRNNESLESEISEISYNDSSDTDIKTSSGDTPRIHMDRSLEESKSNDGTVDYEREEGDGQEYESEEDEGELGSESDEERESDGGRESLPGGGSKEKKLDDDEDRRNPQYIPKRGTFYEHDDRTADNDGTPAVTATPEADRSGDKESGGGNGGGGEDKKKVWRENESRWSHDMYDEGEQTPKTAEELIEIYGYDIRNEEGPPRARRRRRYGRGPNKYTRNWEDEGAYNRPSGPPSLAGGRRNDRGRDDRGRKDKEAFPALPGADDDSARRSLSPARDDRPSVQPTTNNNNSNNAWSRHNRSPVSQQQQLPQPPKEEYPKLGGGGSNQPLQLTPPPERRVIEVIRVQNENKPPGREQQQPVRHPREDVRPEGEPVRRSSGRGVFVRRVKPFESATLVANGRGHDLGSGRPRQAPLRGLVMEQFQDVRTNEPAAYYSKKPDAASMRETAGPKLRTQEDLANDLARMNLYANQNAAPRPALHAYMTEQEQTQRIASREFTRRPEPAVNKNMGYTQQPLQHQQQLQAPLERRQAVVPPRLQQDTAAANRPKRYSSLRQRSLPESGAPLPGQQQAYSQPQQQQQQHQYYQTSYVQGPLAPQQPPMQLMQAVHPPPTTYAATFNSPPAYIQPTPAPHMMRRPPSPGHYLPAPPPPQAVMGYVQQPYPAYQTYTTVAAPPPQPPDLALYQPQGGITYYSPEEQMMSRALTSQQRRQRSAIPIVPPPERYPRGRGRMTDSELTDMYDGGSVAGGHGGGQYSPSGGSDDNGGGGGAYREDEARHYVQYKRGGNGEGKYDDAEVAQHDVQRAAT